YKGTWPTFCGHVVVNLPEGFTSPNKTSEIAYPASLPPNQTFNIAGTLSFSHLIASGRPVNSTNTTGLPVFNTAANKSFCACGISILLRLLLSPLISADSPRAAITTSHCAAIFNASCNNCSFVLPSRLNDLPNMPARCSNTLSSSRNEPFAYNNFAPPFAGFPTVSFKPCNTEMAFEKLAATLQVPGIFSLAS